MDMKTVHEGDGSWKLGNLDSPAFSGRAAAV
jgi:hypothetical protein